MDDFIKRGAAWSPSFKFIYQYSLRSWTNENECVGTTPVLG